MGLYSDDADDENHSKVRSHRNELEKLDAALFKQMLTFYRLSTDFYGFLLTFH